MTTDRNVVLIGMPGAGKSTVGVLLAKRLGYDFIDTDLLIQSREGRRLQAIIDGDGLESFRRLEAEVLTGLDVRRSVIATGGSAVYSEAGMAALKRHGTAVFIDVPLAALAERIRDMDDRGLVIDPGDSLADLYRKRLPLYRRYTDFTVAAAELPPATVAARIEARLCSPS